MKFPGAVDNALPEIHQKRVGVLAVALADQVGDDCFPGRIDPDENVLVAKVRRVSRLDPFLLLADVRPQLVEFESVNLDELHKTVVQLGAAIADADAKAHDRVTMNASQALSSAD